MGTLSTFIVLHPSTEATDMSSSHIAALDATLGDVMTVPEKLIEVRHDTTIEQVLALMAKYGVTSVPVRAAGDAQTPGDSTECIGIINLVDIVAFCVFAIAEGDAYLRVDLSNLESMDAPVSDILGAVSSEASSAWSFKTYPAAAHINDVMYPFCAGVHRVLISTGAPGAEGLVSQTDIVRFLHAHKAELPDELLASPLLPHKGTPVTMSSDQRALVGFRKMVVMDRSSVGIVDDAGVLVGNLSLSDLRGINKSNFASLADPVLDFLASRAEAHTPRPLIKAAPETSLGDVIDLLVAEKVHRVWLVDEAGKPLGQLSMSDVLLAFTDLSLPLVVPE